MNNKCDIKALAKELLTIIDNAGNTGIYRPYINNQIETVKRPFINQAIQALKKGGHIEKFRGRISQVYVWRSIK